MALNLTIRHAGNSTLAGRIATFGEGPITIGRRPDNAVAFDATRDVMVSGHHAVIQVTAAGATLQDVGSANGTFLNGVRVTGEPRPLGDGMTVMLGQGGPMMVIGVQGASAGTVPPTIDAPSRIAAGFNDWSAAPPAAPSTVAPPPPISPPPLRAAADVPAYDARASPSPAPPAVLDGGGVARPPSTPRQTPPPIPRRQPPAPKQGRWNSPASLIMRRTAGKQSIGVNTLMGVMTDLKARDARTTRWLVVGGLLTAGLLAVVALVYVVTRPEAEKAWAQVLEAPGRSVYVVCMLNDDADKVGQPQGTAWSIKPGLLATNSHVAELLLKNPDKKFIARPNCPNGEDPVDVHLASAELHPGYKAFLEMATRYYVMDPKSGKPLDPVPQCDVALLKVVDADIAKQAAPLELASDDELHALRSGQDAAFVGFPMENLGQGGVNAVRPSAQLFTGGVTRVTDPFLTPETSQDKRILISYQLIISGGASGSPVFNRAGRVIGFISAMNAMGMTGAGRLDKSGTAYGPRVDLVRELLESHAAEAQVERTKGWETEFKTRFEAMQSAWKDLAVILALKRVDDVAAQNKQLPPINMKGVSKVMAQDVRVPSRFNVGLPGNDLFVAVVIAENPDLKPSIRFVQPGVQSEYEVSPVYFAIKAAIGQGREMQLEINSSGSIGGAHVLVLRFPFLPGGTGG